MITFEVGLYKDVQMLYGIAPIVVWMSDYIPVIRPELPAIVNFPDRSIDVTFPDKAIGVTFRNHEYKVGVNYEL